ncbi:MAG: response regulator [Alphaproteobacteria bacterium]
MSDVPRRIQDATILVVDDNRVNILLLNGILEAAGYGTVISITDSRQAADVCRSRRIDLVLLDINMPYLDGFQVMEQLAEIHRDDYVPILVLTAHSDRETKIRALGEGARDFLHKPFDHLEVLNRIRNMLEVRLLHLEVLRQNQDLERKVRERTAELEATRFDIIRRLGRAAEFKDNETGMHVVRMSHACAVLARAAGLDERQCDLLLNASPMHDIGKIGIPDRVLLKPGKLDYAEWEIMKTHVTIGADLLDGHQSDLMVMARDVALCHHEKWDGTGYPRGLKGEEIPLVARITSLCDVFDALTSERPYKKAWSVDDAMAEIEKQTGRQFDPRLVPLFRQVLPDVLAIRDKYRDPEGETAGAVLVSA